MRFSSTARLALLVLLAQAAGTAAGQDLAAFERKVTQFRLDNGLTFIVVERHQAPVVSFHTYADVGSAQEVKGITGVAHIFEHMAFKGSHRIGSKDPKKEEAAMARVDQVFAALRAERLRGPRADKARLKTLQKEFKAAQEEASKWVEHDEFDKVFSRAGASGLNASTSWDATRYILSLPSNKLELWMLMESERFLDPVLREFYKEKNVVMEERRLRTESQPIGRLLEEFLAAAYKAHPYGEPVVGHMSDLRAITRQQALEFFRKHYLPSKLTIGIVGDVDPAQVRRLAEKYFGRIPKAPPPDPVVTVEPPQVGERRVYVEDPSQPFVLIGYHKPDINHPDNAVFNAITDILGVGRTSRLYKSLVRDKKIAIVSSAFQGIPGNKYPGLFLFFSVPSRGHTAGECEKAILEEIERLKREPVSEKELEKARTRARASLIRSLASNSGLAGQLTFYQAVTGDWRNLFHQLDAIDKVTAQDIQRVARKYFTSKNRTVGEIKTETAESGGES